MNIFLILKILHLASKVSLEIHLSLKLVHLSFMLAHLNLNLAHFSLKSINLGLKLGNLSHRVCLKFAHLSLKSFYSIHKSREAQIGLFITTWGKKFQMCYLEALRCQLEAQMCWLDAQMYWIGAQMCWMKGQICQLEAKTCRLEAQIGQNFLIFSHWEKIFSVRFLWNFLSEIN